MGPLYIVATVEASNFKFGTQLGFGTSLPKNNVLDKNWQGSGPGEHPKKFGTPYVFLQPLNFKFGTQIGFGTSLPKTTFRTKISWGMGWGEHKKLGPPTYFCNR